MNEENFNQRFIDMFGDIVARLGRIETALAQSVGGHPGPNVQPTEARPSKLNGSTLRAMQRHAPELAEHERKLWLTRLKPGRRYKVKDIERHAFPNDIESRAKAQRICYWLAREGALVFDSNSWEYIRPVPGE